jgi:radical SAM superfamily enzyme YgiQ (UPF0313 family)
MELAARQGDDRFVAAGAYRAIEARLRQRAPELAELPAVVVSAFDRRTRMLPFLFYDSHLFPPGAVAVAGALRAAGFARTRAVFQLWNRRFRPSRARLDGRAAQMLLISSMQIHSQRAYDLIREAWTMGEARPLILTGGPKAIYEPYHYWSIPGTPRVAPDVAVTGEAYVLLDLLQVLLEHRGRTETLRAAFERARRSGALDAVPGLVYLAPGARLDEPVVVDTGLQRLVPQLDEFAREAEGLRVLEPPHRGAALSPQPLAPSRVGRHAMIASILVTQGCRFRCSYCPIPAVNQRSWRTRSPESLVDAIRTVHEGFGIKYFFGADDNFFNHRASAEAVFTALARATTDGRPFGERLRFATEATEVDTYKNRDLLPLGKAGGLYALWFGIEDLTATLVNKGQKATITRELFAHMRDLKISPMPMLMFHSGQPFYTPGSLYGLANQIEFLRTAGAVSLQCTAHTPAPGTREYEATYLTGRVIARTGHTPIREAEIDGNHVVVAAGGEAPWKRQVKLLGGYAAFYNPWNFARALRRDGSPLRRRRLGYQAAGMLATTWTAVKFAPYVVRLMTRRLEMHAAPPAVATVPVHLTVGAAPRYPAEGAVEEPSRQPHQSDPHLALARAPSARSASRRLASEDDFPRGGATG